MKRSASSSLSWHTLHRWAGAALALYVVCTSVTGLVLQYKDDLLALLSFGALAMTVLSITGLAAFLQWLLLRARQRRAAGPMEGRPPAFENRDG